MLLGQPGSEGHDDCEKKHIVSGYNSVRSDNPTEDQVSTKILRRSLFTCCTFLASPVP